MIEELNIVERMRHPGLYGALKKFKNLKTWAMWLVFVKAMFGLPLDAVELEAFKLYTGRTTYDPSEGGFPEGLALSGVQCGKTSIVGVLLGDATLTGKPGTVAIGVSQDHRGSMRVLVRHAREPFETLDVFRAEVSRTTADLLELKRGTSLAAFPCRPEALRGFEASIVVLDEPAFYTSTDGRPTDKEMWRVARGRVANTHGKVIAISSPYAQSGEVYDIHRKHFGRDDSPILVWVAPSFVMNPTLSADYLQRMELDDPEAYRSEVLGEFRSGTSTLFDSDALQTCVEVGVRERMPQPGIRHEGGFDSASGSGKDAGAFTIVHPEGDRVVVDLVREWKPPFNPSGMIAEAADLSKQWGVTVWHGDRYAPGFVLELCRGNGITYQFADQNQSDAYLALLHIVNAQQVLLLDHPVLLRQLRGLERRRGTSGRDRVDHRNGSHDDVAASTATAIVQAKVPAWTNPVYCF